MDPDATRVLEIDFDAGARRFSVTDTGTGMSREDVEIVFRPNISFKRGALARVREADARGEKGVGLSFLLLACDRLTIQTSDGNERFDAVVEGAASWARGEGKVAPPAGWHEPSRKPEEILGSKSYTRLTLESIDFGYFDRDLFAMTQAELTWILRTRTAVGNTAALFADIGHAQPKPVEIRLNYRSPDGERIVTAQLPYRYATPEDLLAEAGGGVSVVSFEELQSLDQGDVRRRTRNGAMRYVTKARSKGGKEILFYVFAMDGNAMNAQLELLDTRTGWAPEEWQGFWVATRDMPTFVRLGDGVIAPRGYERRLFALLHLDDLRLDVGRKSLPGGTVGMLNRVLRDAWDRIGSVVRRMAPAPRNVKAGQLAYNRQLRLAMGLPDLGADVVPYLKIPDKHIGVAALFHELVGARHEALDHLRPLTSGVFRDDDALIFPHEPNGTGPLHVLFGLTPADIVEEVEANEVNAQTAGLAVVWIATAGELAAGVEVGEAAPDEDGATHELLFDGLAGREEPLRMIVLQHLLFPDA